MMDLLKEFPFQIGQRAEAKSNIKGYRGAWFRCEIKDIQLRKDEIWCALQYLDFPDEKVSYTKAYQQDLTEKKRRALMLRPSFPSIQQKSVEKVMGEGNEEVLSINEDWQIEDLVDWWSDNCYWTAKIVGVLNKDVVQVQLPNSPVGEGGTYEAATKDLRPSLEWSLEQYWTVPVSKARDNRNSWVELLDLSLKKDPGSSGSCESLHIKHPEERATASAAFCHSEGIKTDYFISMAHRSTAADTCTSDLKTGADANWNDRHQKLGKQYTSLDCTESENLASLSADVNEIHKPIEEFQKDFSNQVGASSGNIEFGITDLENKEQSTVTWKESLMKNNTSLADFATSKDQKTKLKRKVWSPEYPRISEADDLQDQSMFSKWYKSGEVKSGNVQGASFSVSTPPLLGEIRNIDLVTKLAGNASSHIMFDVLESSRMSKLVETIDQKEKIHMEKVNTLGTLSTIDIESLQKDCKKAVDDDRMEGGLKKLSTCQKQQQNSSLERQSEIEKQANSEWYMQMNQLNVMFDEVKEHKDHLGDMNQEGNSGLNMINLKDSTCDSSKNDQGSHAISYHNIDFFHQMGNHLNLDEDSIVSSIMALEELVSRVVWLKGVLQNGLRGCARERSKKKWQFCQSEFEQVLIEQATVTHQHYCLQQENALDKEHLEDELCFEKAMICRKDGHEQQTEIGKLHLMGSPKEAKEIQELQDGEDMHSNLNDIAG